MHLDGLPDSLLLGTSKIKQIMTLLTELTFRDLLLYCRFSFTFFAERKD